MDRNGMGTAVVSPPLVLFYNSRRFKFIGPPACPLDFWMGLIPLFAEWIMEAKMFFSFDFLKHANLRRKPFLSFVSAATKPKG